MKILYKLLVLILIDSWSVSAAWAQDVGFSQFYDQPFLRNPALAGIFTGDVRVVGAFRNQWESIPVPYKTYGLSSELKTPINIIDDDNLTVGLQIIGDVAGTSKYKTFQLMPAVNYSLPLSAVSNSYLSIGFMGGLRQQQFESANLILNDQFVSASNGTFTILPSSRQVFNDTKTHYFDLSAGLSYNGSVDNMDYYFGVGLFHVTNPQAGFFNQSRILLNKKLAFNFGLTAATSEEDQFIIYGDYFTQLNENYKKIGITTLQTGIMYTHNLFQLGYDQTTVYFGALYRLNDALIPVAKLQVSNFIIGASYDMNISKLVVASHYKGGFELTLSYQNFLNYRNSERRQTRCPIFGKSH